MKSIAERLQELNLYVDYDSEMFKNFVDKNARISQDCSIANNSIRDTDNSQLELQFEAALTDPRRI